MHQPRLAGYDLKRMSQYEPYQPALPERLPPLPLELGLAQNEHIPGIAALAQHYSGGALEKYQENLKAELARGKSGQAKGALFVALWQGQVAGYARLLHYAGEEAMLWPSPPGWYCRGLLVQPELRRRGVASALAEYRLAWLSQQAAQTDVYSFIATPNLTSRDFHLRQGFVEAGRAAGYLNVNFDDGEGILFHKITAACQVPRHA